MGLYFKNKFCGLNWCPLDYPHMHEKDGETATSHGNEGMEPLKKASGGVSKLFSSADGGYEDKSFSCDCMEWGINIRLVDAPIVALNAMTPGFWSYKGLRFIFCPWCSSKLKEDT